LKQLILGGVRSGKSRLAERLARDGGCEVVYVATATAGDDEMRLRIAAHRARRPPHWTTVEAPVALADALAAHARPGRCLLVECLTLWITNLLCADDAGLLARERTAFLQAFPQLPGDVTLVSNETNLGVVPIDSLSRRFCDEVGTLHQELAGLCDRVVLTVAGLPHVLKGDPI
jgi:adenosylcobinamide kinase/adenosylcobinamide-phosphate guanylyltransferase